MRVCIYCLRRKPASEFNVEHVLPQSFGKFNSRSPTLDCVCIECNKGFGDSIELIFGRDSIEGTLRYTYGIKRDSEFGYPPGGFKRTLHEYQGGQLHGMILERFFDKNLGQVSVRPVPQVGIRLKNSEKFRWFSKGKIPSKNSPVVDELDINTPRCFLFMGECNSDFYNQFHVLGWTLADQGEYRMTPQEGVDCKATYTLDAMCCRAIAKIAFNYLAYECGEDMALMPAFNEVRDYVYKGIGLNRAFVEPRSEPILIDERDGAQVKVIHMITVGRENSGKVTANVTLFNQVRYRVTLSDYLPEEIKVPSKGLFFNIRDKSIGDLDAVPNPKQIMMILENGLDLVHLTKRRRLAKP